MFSDDLTIAYNVLKKLKTEKAKQDKRCRSNWLKCNNFHHQLREGIKSDDMKKKRNLIPVEWNENDLTKATLTDVEVDDQRRRRFPTVKPREERAAIQLKMSVSSLYQNIIIYTDGVIHT